MRKTPASIGHDGTGDESAERFRRFQTGSWPGGQGERRLRKLRRKESSIKMQANVTADLKAGHCRDRERRPPQKAAATKA
jgi:hypothetical protein